MKRITILILLLVSGLLSKAQEKYSIKDNLDLKIEVSALKLQPHKLKQVLITGNRTVRTELSLNYGVLDYLDVGISLSEHLGRFLIPEDFGNQTTGYIAKYKAIFTPGINTNFHIFPLFIKSENFRFDLYLSARLGYMLSNGDLEWDPWQWSIGAGIGMKLSKRWRLCFDYNYGNIHFVKHEFQLGFKIKLK